MTTPASDPVLVTRLADPDAIERACEVMHDAYEKAAQSEGWETQERSRKPWADVPEANKATMRAAVAALGEHLAAVVEGRVQERIAEALDEAADEVPWDQYAEERRDVSGWLRDRAAAHHRTPRCTANGCDATNDLKQAGPLGDRCPEHWREP